MRKKDHIQKLILYFFTALLVTLLVGVIILWGYAKTGKKAPNDKKDVASVQNENQQIGEAGEIQDIPTDMQQEDSHKNELPSAGVFGNTDSTNGDSSAENSDADLNSENDSTDLQGVTKLGNGDGTASLVFGGDICFHDPYSNMGTLSQRGGKIDSCIDKTLLDEMKNADFCMLNNEFCYSDRGTPLQDKQYAFRSKPSNVGLLSQMGVDAVSLANNHAYDYGPDALSDTLEILKKEGIKTIGAGNDLKEASEIAYFNIDGTKVGVLAATQIERTETPDTKGATDTQPGVLRCFNEKELNHFTDLIKEAKEKSDFVIVYIHWGTENTDTLDWAQPYQADLITKAGADLIIGSHPHCLQGIGKVNNVPVVYSLGNYWFNSKTVDTGLVKVKLKDGAISQMTFIPALQSNCSTSALSDGEKQRVISYMKSISPDVSIDEEGNVSW